MKEHQYSIRLSREPTLAQAAAILRAVESALQEMGAEIDHPSPSVLKFHMPSPLRTGRLNPLLAVTGGHVAVSAGGGSRRRIRYTLSFLRLHIFALVALLLAVALGLHLARVTLVATLVLVWVLVFFVPWQVAARRFRRVISRAAASYASVGP